MFVYPPQSLVDRVMPKNMIYKNIRVSTALKNQFVSQVKEIVWKYKLSENTINLAPKDGVAEIQVFEITLKTPDLSHNVLKIIDKAIPYPIFYRLYYQKSINCIVAYKRPSESDAGKWVIQDYFETGWDHWESRKKPLPVGLDLKSLYDQMMMYYVGLVPRDQETIVELIDRMQQIRKTEKKLYLLEAKMAKEIQFNRKVEINAQLRILKQELQRLQ